MNARQIFKKALKDPALKGIDYISSSNLKKIVDSITKSLKDDYVISEWKHTLGNVRYEYHVHTDGIKYGLIKLYLKNIRGGNPKLVNFYSKRRHLYSRKKLENIIQEAQKEGYS